MMNFFLHSRQFLTIIIKDSLLNIFLQLQSVHWKNDMNKLNIYSIHVYLTRIRNMYIWKLWEPPVEALCPLDGVSSVHFAVSQFSIYIEG